MIKLKILKDENIENERKRITRIAFYNFFEIIYEKIKDKKDYIEFDFEIIKERILKECEILYKTLISAFSDGEKYLKFTNGTGFISQIPIPKFNEIIDMTFKINKNKNFEKKCRENNISNIENYNKQTYWLNEYCLKEIKMSFPKMFDDILVIYKNHSFEEFLQYCKNKNITLYFYKHNIFPKDEKIIKEIGKKDFDYLNNIYKEYCLKLYGNHWLNKEECDKLLDRLKKELKKNDKVIEEDYYFVVLRETNQIQGLKNFLEILKKEILELEKKIE